MTMPETTPEMLAKRIAHRMVPNRRGDIQSVIYQAAECAALAAIKETTERAAKTCEQRGHVTSADALRNGEHYHG